MQATQERMMMDNATPQESQTYTDTEKAAVPASKSSKKSVDGLTIAIYFCLFQTILWLIFNAFVLLVGPHNDTVAQGFAWFLVLTVPAMILYGILTLVLLIVKRARQV